MKIKFSEQADHDLDAIKFYIAQDNQAAAERTAARIEGDTIVIVTLVHMYRLYP